MACWWIESRNSGTTCGAHPETSTVAPVEVSGWAPQVVPLLRLSIHQHATSPVERFYAPTQQVGTGGATTGTGP